MSESPATRRRLFESVAERIATGIIEGRWRVSERLPAERDLAHDLGVSRPVVREALLALELQGLVEIRMRSGVVVRAIPGRVPPVFGGIGPGPFELLEARLAIEPGAAALAAERATAADLAQLAALIRQMERETEAPLGEEHADRQFHTMIAESSGNRLVRSMVDGLWDLRGESALWLKLHEHIHAPAIRPLWIGDHQAILAALTVRNPEAARRAMEHHLRNVTAELLAASGKDMFGTGLDPSPAA